MFLVLCCFSEILMSFLHDILLRIMERFLFSNVKHGCVISEGM